MYERNLLQEQARAAFEDHIIMYGEEIKPIHQGMTCQRKASLVVGALAAVVLVLWWVWVSA